MSFQIPASYVSKAHTISASLAFLSALLIGLSLHYRKIVQNEVAGYPEEWWPSVSATIGDRYPERSIFQILIALTAGPRFALVFCWWLLTRSSTSLFPSFVALCGVARTLSCGGWVYITSSDDHNAHDVLMILYMVLNVPWMVGSILCTPYANVATRKKRKLIATLFFLAVVPMIYLFIQHKVYRIPGAYTKYSFFEWFLIFADVWFDSVTAGDFSALEIALTGALPAVIHPKKYDTEQPRFRQSLAMKDHSSSSPIPASSKLHQAIPKAETAASETGHPSSLVNDIHASYAISFLADVYLAYIWWSIFTSLAPSLFYFSVWQLSISGQEISLITTLSPVLLGVSSVRATLSTHRGRTWLQVLSIIGLIAYKFEGPLERLFAVSLANVSGSILKAIEWSDHQEAERYGTILALGLVISSLSKLVNHSVNPLWPLVNAQSGGWNKTGILLAALSIWDYATRNSPDPTMQIPVASIPSKKFDDFSTQKVKFEGLASRTTAGFGTRLLEHWSLASISLGGLIFSLHCLLADSGTLIAQSWTGYPIAGPYPGFHGYLTLIAMAVGIVISSSNLKHLVRHPIWTVFGVLSAYFMYQWRDWPGYVAGLCLSVFLTSLIPVIISLVAVHGRKAPGKVYFTAWLVVCLLDLANVWTVAYAFVPAGWVLRERTDIVLAIQLIAIGLGLIPAWRRLSLSPLPSPVMSSFRHQVRRLLVFLTSVSLLVTTARFPEKMPIPHHAAQRLITAGIWTVHFGIDDSGRESQYRMRDLIRDMELDVVGLLETDLHRIVFGNRDLTRVIAEDLGYFVDIGPGPNSHTWGAVLLSKFPILISTHHLLPSPHGELAPAIEAILDVWGQNITVVVSHNGQEEDPLDRELQSTELARIMASTPYPVIFLGYVVSTPHATRPNPYEILVTDGRVHDIDDEDMDRWCEYILYRGLYRVSYARVSRSTITDTELQVGKFMVPKIGHPIINASRAERYLRSHRDTFPESVWFPDEFLASLHPGGKRGHFYHVHPSPLYYRLPENATV